MEERTVKTASEARLTADQRKTSAAIIRDNNGKKEYKFPIPDKEHARQALRMIDQSDLTEAEKSKVRARAKKMLGEEEYSRWVKENNMVDEANPQLDELESSEVKGSSMGGHSPKADVKPTSNLVRSFGKWAKGKQHVCVRVLMTHHPELCKGTDGCNDLCAWLKDQFRGTTKWRVGNKKNLRKKVTEAYIDLGDGEEWVIPDDLALDFMAAEADIVDGKREEELPRPDYFTEEEEAKLIALLEKDELGAESTEAEMSYNDLLTKIGDLVRNKVRKASNDVSVYPYIKDVYPGYVIYCTEYTTQDGVRERDLYRQAYTVASENVTLVGDPKKVVQTYVAAESDVDEPVSNPSVQEATSLNNRIRMVENAIRNRYANKNSAAEGEPTELSYVYVRDTFDDYVIFSDEYSDEQMWKQNYKIVSEGDDESVELVGERVKVKQEYIEESDSIKSPTEVATMGSERNKEFVYITMENDSRLVAEMDSDTGEILRGPKDLVGMFLQLDPSAVNESLVNESGIISDDTAVEMMIYEHDAHDSQIVEAAASGGKLKTPKGSEVDAIVRIIVPGPGNARDKFYYTSESIKNSITVFDGKKMYKDHTTPKQDAERNGAPRYFDDWVATIEDVWTDESGVGYGGVTFVDDAFAAKAKKGMKHLGVSVRGRVKARPGNIGGTQYNVVEGFTYGASVDFVTEAGAGGGVVSIAESDIMEGDLMDPKEMTLDQLMEANPGAFVEHAERLAQDDSSESVTTSEKSEVTMEAISELIDSKLSAFGESIKADVKESLTTRDLQDNRMILEDKLKTSGLPKATKDRLRRELHDVTFSGSEATESEPAQTPLEQFAAHADTVIAEAEAELKEAVESVTEVNDGGAGEISVTESALRPQVVAKPTQVNERIAKTLGITLVGSKQDASETAAAEATA